MSESFLPCASRCLVKLSYSILLCVCLTSGGWSPSSVQAATYYVNNQTGSDEHDGLSEKSAVASIARAIALSQTSDTIELSSTGRPYREPMLFRKLGGTPDRPFVLEGNGAVVSGLQALDASQWKSTGEGVYVLQLEKTPYGNPFLVSRGKRLPAAKNRDVLKEGEHYWDRKTSRVYFYCEAGKQPADYDLEATLHVSGFTLTSASYISCRHLICEYFSNDGFNIHGDCRGIRLENVIARHNGDDGISIHEAGGLIVQNAYVHDNFYGIQDVNASRSVYNGVLAEMNQVGVSLVGGYHSLVDCQIRKNARSEIDIAGSNPGHLIGAEQNLLCQTILFAQNVSVFGAGSQMGLSVRNGGRAIMEHSVICGSGTGVYVDRLSHCHLTLTAVSQCETVLNLQSKQCFCDFNLYSPGQFHWLETVYAADQWSEYQKTSQLDPHSRIEELTVGADGTVSAPGEAMIFSGRKQIVGPTAPFSLRFQQD
ncbi:right-handed parallel beta-helix repeat-containing protein [Gimesia panareensis]|uniref:right-handed parallel beta-helix repeat-containing protein n=1 Tax=Gimesia panareensis TaxID=2527978 RepID=UPI00118C4EDD|nr:right-handed parallel beta-helix repeat-containing protein [Gimesia panareensis]QDU53470.1 hypothetical protein Pan110_58620 [Gimesia panareensis]